MKVSIDDNSPFLFADPSYFQRFRGLLEEASYFDEGIGKRLFVNDYSSIGLNETARLLRRTSQGTPLDTLIRLFLAGAPVDLPAARKSFQGLEMGPLVEAGLIRIEGSRVSAAVKLVPFHVKMPPAQHLFIAHDYPHRLQSSSRHDYVMGIANSSIVLANVTVRKQVGASLDLGAGCGFHALLASRHSDRVTAVDLNARAVKLATFNAKLNGMSHIECLEGDLFGPVKGRKFDLIVSNPPFVISPGLDYLYRDSAMRGDRICRKIVREAPDYLNEGGYCQLLCNWVESPGGDWAENIKQWFEGTGCDVWVIRTETRDAEAYASKWIRHTELDRARDADRLFEQWMEYYEEQGIEAISHGLIAMRRSSGRSNWFRAEDGPEKLIGPCGDLIERGFKLKDFLETVGDDSRLLDVALIISPDARLEVQFSPSSGGWAEVGSPHLSLIRGLSIPGSIDAFLAKLLIGCNGENRLANLMKDLADFLESDPASIAPQFCGIVRRLVEQGFLLPVHLGGEQ